MRALLRTPDVEAEYGLGQSLLEKARHKGTGPAYVKIGRVVAYRREDIDAWLATKVVRSTSEADERAK